MDIIPAEMLEAKKKEMDKLMGRYLPSINATLEKWIPRQVTRENVNQICGIQRYDCDFEALNKATTEPIWELLDRGGKRWRSTLLLLVAEALSKKSEEVIDFVVLSEIIHNGSLIIDDIEDNSEYRRGKPCLHILKGLDVSINVGNLMYFLPLRVLKERRESLSESVLLKCYEVYSQEMLNVHLGQGLDIIWHSQTASGAGKEPTVGNYLQMCANKTGALARMSAKMSAIICGGTDEQVEAIGNFAESVGIAFQIQDDILNLDQRTLLATNKGGAGEDIHEGKRTIMVIHCFDTAPEEDVKRLKEILAMKTNDFGLINEAIDILQRNKGIEFAQNKANELMKSAWNHVETLLPDTSAKMKLKALVDYLVQRKV